MIKEVKYTTSKIVSFSTFTSSLDYENIIHCGSTFMWTYVVRLVWVTGWTSGRYLPEVGNGNFKNEHPIYLSDIQNRNLKNEHLVVIYGRYKIEIFQMNIR